MSRKKKRKPTDGGEALTHSPFDKLSNLGDLPSGPEEEAAEFEPPPQPTSRRDRKNTNRGRLNITRETAHRGGKVVTVVSNFKGISQAEKEALAKKMKTALGVGGTIKDGRIEIRGDNREVVKQILEEAGFQPVFAGG